MLKLREGLRVIYRPNLWDSLIRNLPKGITGTVTRSGAEFGYYKGLTNNLVNVNWDNGMTDGVSINSLESIT
jgi:hypothetical protein